MLRGKTAQQGRQAVQTHMVAGGQAQAAANGCTQMLQHAAGVLQLGQDALRARQQRLSGFGQHHLPAQAIEQPRRQLRLQECNAFAYRRLGQVQGLAGCRKAAALGDRHECIEARQVHCYS
ncbi:hypothetical protein FHY31_002220 [Xanthomonas euvesicatoria]|uniref:Avirulence protein n=1 Tax=Xanthomonas euvesicatoria TaxID=456327 RepID=A0AAW3U4G7_XANEU|nr:hypothetical protein [Xanthomonas euvesicatoria]MBB4870458.1 hypothetical protein [Xanthomonas euvesicatoria]